METTTAKSITIETTVNAPIEKVWQYWTSPQHLLKWNTASPDWHTTRAESDLRVGGKFSSRMEARDGSFGFDFGGVYDAVKTNEYIAFTMGDGRKVETRFTAAGDTTRIVETFDPETQNSIEMQRNGWQAILDNFKLYTETN